MRLSHDEYYLEMLKLVAARSTCGRRDVGAIITDERGRILSTGYNGVPRNHPHCKETGYANDRPCPGRFDKSGDNTRCEAIHAEVNAILQCHRLDTAFTLYVSCAPCFSCSKMIANTLIKRVVCLEEYPGEGAKVLSRSRVNLIVANRPQTV